MKLIKFLFKFIFGIICLVIVIIVATIVLITNGSRDHSYLDKIDQNSTFDTIILTDLHNEVNDLSDCHINLSLNEDDINNLLYNLIKTKINTSYDPINGKTDEEVNIVYDSIPNVPVINSIDFAITNAYCQLNGNELSFVVDAIAVGFKTKLVFGFSFTTTEDSYVFTISSLRFGRISVYNMRNLILKYMAKYLEDEIKLSDNIVLKADYEDLSFSLSKKDFASYIKNTLATMELDSTISDLLTIVTDPNNDAISLNIENDKVDFDGNLSFLATTDKVNITQISQAFNQDLFIQGKVQSLALASVASGEKNLVFTYNDINNLLYNQTNGYNDFNIESSISENLTLKIIFNEISFGTIGDKICLKILFSINNLNTKAFITFTSENDGDDLACLVLDDIMILGDDTNVNTNILTTILGDALSQSELLTYNQEKNRLEFSKSLFDSFISQGNLSSTLEVKKIYFNTTGLVITTELTNSELNEKFNKVSVTITNVLAKDFVDTTKFTGDDQEVIDNLVSSLDNLQASITEENLSMDEVNSFIDSMSSLSSENQQELLTQIEDSLTEEDLDLLEQLYKDLFN